MKTAISLPDPVFQAAENLAGQLKISRSELYAKAVSQFVEEHKKDNVTELLNKVYSDNSASIGVEKEMMEMQLKSLSDEKW